MAEKIREAIIIAALIPGTLAADRQCYTALGISRATFWGKLVKTGIVPPVKLSERCTRFRTDDVLALMAPVEKA